MDDVKSPADHPSPVPDRLPQHLFAYGTLQPGLAPASVRPWVDRLVGVGPASVAGTLYDLGPYPGATFGTPGVVHGRVYQLPPGDEPAIWAALDAYEGVPDLYVRRTVDVTLATGHRLACQAYQYHGDIAGLSPVPSGRYAGRAP